VLAFEDIRLGDKEQAAEALGVSLLAGTGPRAGVNHPLMRGEHSDTRPLFWSTVGTSAMTPFTQAAETRARTTMLSNI